MFDFILAQEKDFDVIWSMLIEAKAKLYEEEVFQWDDTYPTPEMIKRDIKGNDTYLVYKEEELIAFLVVNDIIEDDVHDNIEWKYPNELYFVLHRLCVSTTTQGKGYGTKVVKQVEAMYRDKDIHIGRIDVFSTNAVAIHIYEKIVRMNYKYNIGSYY